MMGLGSPDAARAQEAEGQFKRHARVLDNHLAGHTYLLGARLSLADYALAPSLLAGGPNALSLAQFPNLQRWFTSIEQLPAWKATATSRQ